MWSVHELMSAVKQSCEYIKAAGRSCQLSLITLSAPSTSTGHLHTFGRSSASLNCRRRSQGHRPVECECRLPRVISGDKFKTPRGCGANYTTENKNGETSCLLLDPDHSMGENKNKYSLS